MSHIQRLIDSLSFMVNKMWFYEIVKLISSDEESSRWRVQQVDETQEVISQMETTFSSIYVPFNLFY